MSQEVSQEAEAQERACVFCGKSLEGMRKDAKFCKPAHRLKWHRRQAGVKVQRRQRNNLDTDMLERHIALAIFYDVTGESALRLLAERLEAPIRQEEIDKQLIKVKEESERILSGREGA